MTPGDLALGLMLLDAMDDRSVADLLRDSEACPDTPGVRRAREGLREILSLHGEARITKLIAIQNDFDDSSSVATLHPFHELPAEIASDYISGQRSTIEQLEAHALAAERGTPLPMPAIRRAVHTMKGESGMVGLDTMVSLWHGLEARFVDTSEAPLAAMILAAVSWAGASLDGLVVGRIPLSPPESLWDAPSHEPQNSISTPSTEVAAGVQPYAAPLGGAAAVTPIFPVPDAGRVHEAPPPVAAKPIAMVPPVADAAAPIAEPEPAAAGTCVRDEETLLILGEFLLESTDGVAQADDLLMRVEHGETESGDIDTLFRTFHSMKGVAAALELDSAATLAHAMEDLLGKCREGSLRFEGAAVSGLLDGTHLVRILLEGYRGAVERHAAFVNHPGVPPLAARLRAIADGKSIAESEVPAAKAPAAPVALPRVEPVLIAPVTPAPSAAPASDLRVIVPVRVPESATRAAEPVPVPVRAQAEPEPVAARPVAKAAVPAHPTPIPVKTPSTPAEHAATPKIRETVKVDLDRVDQLVELIGELVIAEAMVAGRAELSGAPDLRNALRHLTKIVRDLQRMGVSLRMVPLAGVFQKMRRLVRDLSVKVGKEAILNTAGEGIEMDRSLVEQIADPLVHILRNSMDHGLENPEGRRVAGKPVQGQLTLSAAHEGGNIVIEVRDDGRGMNRDRILQRARERGLIAADAILQDHEVYELVFAPGFSTAEQVTEVSGRGVGMDVVKKNIEAMGGRVRVDSTPGVGTVIRLTVPLTLAIIDGMLIGCGGERFIVPTLSIVESIRPESDIVVNYAGRFEVVDIRGTLMPLLRLDRCLGLVGAAQNPRDGLLIIVDGITRRFAILVDEVVSRQQVVIKAMDDVLIDTRFYSGACILADGKAGLILNIDALLLSGSRLEALGGLV